MARKLRQYDTEYKSRAVKLALQQKMSENWDII